MGHVVIGPGAKILAMGLGGLAGLALCVLGVMVLLGVVCACVDRVRGRA